MKNFWECLLIATLFFIATLALLTVDSRGAETCDVQSVFCNILWIDCNCAMESNIDCGENKIMKRLSKLRESSPLCFFAGSVQ